MRTSWSASTWARTSTATLTLVPISTEPILVDELSRDQINWLNDYHAHVYEMLSPRLNEDEKVWLKEKCAAIGR